VWSPESPESISRLDTPLSKAPCLPQRLSTIRDRHASHDHLYENNLFLGEEMEKWEERVMVNFLSDKSSASEWKGDGPGDWAPKGAGRSWMKWKERRWLGSVASEGAGPPHSVVRRPSPSLEE